MQEKPKPNQKLKSVLSVSVLLKSMKRFFFPWLITSTIALTGIVGGFTIKNQIENTISVNVNFSFNGIESGHDPHGNKFDVNEIKSVTAVEKAAKAVGIKNPDIDVLCNSISILGNIPSDAINRITDYTSIYSSANTENNNELSNTKNIGEYSYYPTQYTINMNTHEVDGVSAKKCTEFLNVLTENYKQDFINKYGYHTSLSNVIKAYNYNDYDYSDTVFVLDTSLESLQNYISSLDNNYRFRSEQTGYTFSDLEQSIETLRGENIGIIASYIDLYNMTKNKENLIVTYEYRIEEFERLKKNNEEKHKAVKSSLEIYEKNSIMIFSKGVYGTDTSLSQSSDTYDTLVQMEINTKNNVSYYDQQIKKYSTLIKKIKENEGTGSVEKLEKDFENLKSKINILLDNIEQTSKEYYENVIYLNAYDILKPADQSFLSTLLSIIKQSLSIVMAVEFLIFAAYISVSLAATFPKFNTLISQKNKKTENNNKKGKSKGGSK